MTSANSSYKSKGRLLRETWEKTIWLPSLCFLIFFFVLPVAQGLSLNGLENQDLTAVAMKEAVNNLFFFSNILTKGALAFCALLSGCTYFFYLHNRRQLDFYHSLPISRTKLYFNQYIAGALAALVPYVVMLLLAALVTVLFGYGGYVQWGSFWLSLVFHVLFFLVIYSIVIVAAMLTGNVVLQVIVAAVLFAVFPAALFLAYATMSLFFTTYYAEMSNLAIFALKSSPLTAYFAYGTENLPVTALLAVILLLGIVVFGGLALLLYRRRQTEAAGHAIAFASFRPILKYPVMFLTALAGGLFFREISQSDGWLLFGLLLGAFLSNRIIEIIYAFDFKAVTKRFASLGIFMVVFLALFSVPYFDLLGFDRSVPAADEVEEVLFYPSEYLLTGYYYEEGAETLTYNWVASAKSELIRLEPYRVTSEEGIRAAVNIAKTYTANLPQKEDMENYSNDSVQLQVIYKLKSGKTVARVYPGASFLASKKDMFAILNDRDYKERQLPPAELPYALIVQGLSSFADSSDMVVTYPADMDAGFVKQLYAACREELLNFDASQLATETALGTVSFKSVSNSKSDNFYMTWDCPVYSSFTKVLALLAEKGYDSAYFTVNADAIGSIQITKNDYSKSYGDDPVETETVTDKDEIAAILAATEPSGSTQYNPFIKEEPRQANEYETSYIPYDGETGEPLARRVKVERWLAEAQ